MTDRQTPRTPDGAKKAQKMICLPAREKATVFLTLEMLSLRPRGSMFLMACLAAPLVSGGRNFSDSALQ